MVSLVRLIQQTLEEAPPGWNALVPALSRSLWLALARLFVPGAAGAGPGPTGVWGPVVLSENRSLFFRARAWVLLHAHESPSVEDVARHLGVSVRTLQRVFASRRVSFRRFLQEVRLETARFRLIATDHPAKVIALDSGYRDQAHFTQAFASRFRLSPVKYRSLRQG